MSTWRQRGEVLDSDDEKDLVSSSWPLQDVSPNKPITGRSNRHTKQPAITVTNSGQENSLEHDAEPSQQLDDLTAIKNSLVFSHAKSGVLSRLKDRQAERAPQEPRSIIAPDAEDVLSSQSSVFWSPRRTPQRQANQPRSGTSSPLSELGTQTPEFSQRDLQRLRRADNEARERSERTQAESAIDAEHRQILQQLTAAALQDGPANRRGLRTRTANQLHPFQAERARYLELCKSRGMRPVRIVDAMTQAQSHDTLADSDPASSQDSSSQERTQSLLDSQLNDSGEVIEGVADVPARRAQDDRDQLQVQVGNKRRKLDHIANLEGRLRRPLLIARPQQDLLPSPSPSTSSIEVAHQTTKTHGPARFRRPPGMTPPLALPTPDISSDVRPMHDHDHAHGSEMDIVPDFSPSQRSARPVAMSLSSSDSEHDSTSPTRPPDINMQTSRLAKERRRIRGVLPASWLRIDMRKQTSDQRGLNDRSVGAPRTVRNDHHVTAHSPAKGVAQRVLTNTTKARQPIVLEDGFSSGSDSDASIRQPARELVQTQLGYAGHNQLAIGAALPDVDDMEHDWIDPLSAAGNASRSRGKARVRQPTIRQAFDGAHRRVPVQGASKDVAPHPVSRKRQKHHLKHASLLRQTQIPRLSILDLSEQSDNATAHPQFVRLARRRARKHPDQARQSPSGKQLRLHSLVDTSDAVQTLQQWRRGTIAPRRSKGRTRQQQQSRLDSHVRTISSPTPATGLSHAVQSFDAMTPGPQTTGVRTMLAAGNAAAPSQHRLHKPVSSRQPASGKQPVSRTAQLEVAQSSVPYTRRADVFAEKLRYLTSVRTAVPPVARPTRHLPSIDYKLGGLHNANEAPTEDVVQSIEPKEPLTRPRGLTRRRKRFVQRVIIPEAMVELDDPIDSPKDTLPTTDTTLSASRRDDTLYGLHSFYQPPSIDYGLLPLRTGQCFDTSTFIGSGDFAVSLNMGHRDLSKAAGRITIHLDGAVHEWSGWTEQIRAGLSDISSAIVEMSETLLSQPGTTTKDEGVAAALTCTDYLMRSVVRYTTHCLHFYDDIDQNDCALALSSFCKALRPAYTAEHSRSILPFVLVLAAQAVKLTRSGPVAAAARLSAKDNLSSIATHVVGSSLHQGLASLQEDLQSVQNQSQRHLIRQDHSAFALLVQTHCILQQFHHDSIWTLVNSVVMHTHSERDVREHERVWQGFICLQAVGCIDQSGIVHAIPPSNRHASDWTLPTSLLKIVLDHYDETSKLPGSTVNQYVKILLRRTAVLIQRWNWCKCEMLLNAVFDFYARRGLGLLNGEEARGSPAFLNALFSAPSLEPAADDTSYHLFLKMLASSFKHLRNRSLYADKKIASLLWRYVPSHGRVHTKDLELRQEDISALRNHFDILCTLYYISPPDHRLKISMLQGLIDHTNGHRAACLISIRAWSCLTCFQASMAETFSALQALLDWYKAVVDAACKQYRLARTEAETDYLTAQLEGTCHVSAEQVEAVVVQNQKHVVASLVDVLVGLKKAVRHARNGTTLISMMQTCQHWTVLADMDVSDPAVKPVVLETLHIMDECLLATRTPALKTIRISQSEDSQEFGDMSGLEELAATLDSSDHDEHQDVTTVLQQPATQILSNVFGAESAPDDILLSTSLNTWINLEEQLVVKGRKTWLDVVDGYTGSWHQLRDTRQRQLYTPRLLAMIVARTSWRDAIRVRVLSDWAVGIVTRESSLKHEHELIAALLNCWQADPLLFNTPFHKDPATSLYSITIEMFRQRRLLLLDMVLNNMQQDVQDTLNNATQKEKRGVYATILRRMMTAMKENYKEVSGKRDDFLDPNVQGTYVDFVHKVVMLLQEHTTDICAVDKYFLDSAAFPLPANDPSYVVGRLRSFSSKLGDIRTQKELAVFLHNTLVRGLAGNKQQYLVDQLVAAMSSDGQQNGKASSLRCFLLSTILPTYMAEFNKHWSIASLAEPLTTAVGLAMRQAMFEPPMDCTHDIVQALTGFYHACQVSTQAACDQRDIRSHAGPFVVSVLQAVQNSLSIAHWLVDSSPSDKDLVNSLRSLNHSCLALSTPINMGKVHGDHLPAHTSSTISSIAQDGSRYTDQTRIARSDITLFISEHILRSHIQEWTEASDQRWSIRQSDTSQQAESARAALDSSDVRRTAEEVCEASETVFGRQRWPVKRHEAPSGVESLSSLQI